MMKTVLIIDDDRDIQHILTDTIRSKFEDVVCDCVSDFGVAMDRVAKGRPDAVILDLMQGQQSDSLPGERTWRSIWDKSFCPIIIYSGTDADIDPPVRAGHPFMERIQKGDGSLDRVVASLHRFAPFTKSVRALRDEVDAVIQKVLRDTAGEGHTLMSDQAQLLHAGRRRIAATMDLPTITNGRPMHCWEHYLVPAMGEKPLTGDVLFSRGEDRGCVANYRVVLSPSCDMAHGKVRSVLTAVCHPISEMVDKFRQTFRGQQAATVEKRLLSSLVLSQGFWNGWMPLPKFGEVIPLSVANLKDLQLIDLASIGPIDSTTHEFLRIASMDSPFREQVAWAYLTTAARPGMPDRELDSWAQEILGALG